MDVRRRTEEIEHLTFAPWATFSDASRGRAVPEPQDPLRPVFQRLLPPKAPLHGVHEKEWKTLSHTALNSLCSLVRLVSLGEGIMSF